MVPAGVWPHLFPPKRQLPALQELSFYNQWYEEPLEYSAAALDMSNISRLISCCPGLRDVGICVQPGVTLSALAQLTSLSSLCVTGVDAEAFTSLQPLSQLANLQSLQVDLNSPLSPCSLLCLTAMTALKCLVVTAGPLDFDGAAAVALCLTEVRHWPVAMCMQCGTSFPCLLTGGLTIKCRTCQRPSCCRSRCHGHAAAMAMAMQDGHAAAAG